MGVIKVSVTKARGNLSSLIRQALAGENVVITRRGRELVEIRAIEKVCCIPISRAEIRLRRQARSKVGLSAVDLLNKMYGEDR